MGQVSTAIVEASRDTLARHARTFRWASLFLPPSCRDDAAVVYALCRLVDDVVDEAPTEEGAALELSRLEAELRGEASPRPLVETGRAVLERGGAGLGPMLELVRGVAGDLGPVRFADDRALLRYSYRVAGTVGLMMCGVLGVRDEAALPFAVDLGVAMQLTNICRDVAEDAARGRVYLPADRLEAAGTSQSALLAGTAPRAAVAAVVGDLLDLADRYYASADLGMRYIPARSRLAILVASRTYRAIGGVLRRRGGDALAGRVWVSPIGKAVHGVSALGAFAALALAAGPAHDPQLHRALDGLPGTHA